VQHRIVFQNGKKMSESQQIIQEENKQPMLEENGIFCSGVNSEPEHY